MLWEIQFSSSRRKFVLATPFSNHPLSRRTRAPPIGPSRAYPAFPCETMEGEKQPWPEEIENQANPNLWAPGRPGRVKKSSPIKDDLKPGAGSPKKRQYPLWNETLGGICPQIQKFQEYGLILACCSHTRQDLMAINDIVQNGIPRDSLWYSVLDLKGAYFCILAD